MRVLILSLLIINLFTFAYTREDVSNAKYLAEKNIIGEQDTTAGYRLKDTITRAEVIHLALKMRWIGVPTKYTCKNYFSDIKYDADNAWICSVIEIAVDNKILSKDNKKFRPLEPATRIEALSMIMRAGGLSLKQEWSSSYNKITIETDAPEGWQKDVLLSGYIKWIISPLETSGQWEKITMKFLPDKKVTRATIFGFVKNALPFQIEKKYTVSLDTVCEKKPQGIQKVKLSGKTPILNIFPLPLKNAFSGSYIVKDGLVTYVAKKVSENDILLWSYLYQYDCSQKTTKNISASLISGLYTGMEIEDVDSTSLLARIYRGEYTLPGSYIFYIYKFSDEKWIFIKWNAFSGLEKYKKSPTSRYLTTVEKLRLNKGIIEAKIVTNDAGENSDPTSIPEYKVISEKWVQWDSKTESLK